MKNYRSLYYESRDKSYLLVSKDGEFITHTKIKASSLDEAIEQVRREPYFIQPTYWTVKGDTFALKQPRKVKT